MRTPSLSLAGAAAPATAAARVTAAVPLVAAATAGIGAMAAVAAAGCSLRRRLLLLLPLLLYTCMYQPPVVVYDSVSVPPDPRAFDEVKLERACASSYGPAKLTI